MPYLPKILTNHLYIAFLFLSVPLNSKLTVTIFPYNLNYTEMDSTYCVVLEVCAHDHIKQISKIIRMM